MQLHMRIGREPGLGKAAGISLENRVSEVFQINVPQQGTKQSSAFWAGFGSVSGGGDVLWRGEKARGVAASEEKRNRGMGWTRGEPGGSLLLPCCTARYSTLLADMVRIVAVSMRTQTWFEAPV